MGEGTAGTCGQEKLRERMCRGRGCAPEFETFDRHFGDLILTNGQWGTTRARCSEASSDMLKGLCLVARHMLSDRRGALGKTFIPVTQVVHAVGSVPDGRIDAHSFSVSGRSSQDDLFKMITA